MSSAGSAIFRTGRRHWGVILICLFLAGCSATRFAYNQLDWVMVWYIGGYFSLEEEQKEQLKEIVDRNLEWHRRDQLPKYVSLLRELEDANSAGVLETQELDYFYDRFIELWDEFIVHATPEITAFLALLTDEQVEEFIANLEESNQELWEEYAGTTPEDRRKSRKEAVIKGFERFYGRLSDVQEELILSYLDQLNDVSEEWIAGRRLWQQKFRSLIIERPPEPEFSERMLDLMLQPNQFDSPEYRRLVEENRLIMLEMTSALSAQLTEKQRKKLAKRLKKLIRNLEILAEQKT